MHRIARTAVLLLILLAGACSQAPVTVTETQAPPSPTSPVPTPPKLLFPLPPGATLRPLYDPPREMQSYIDPAGWYKAVFPADWKPTDKPNVFAGEDGSFETGYLPEMMFMRGAMDVCQWLANITTKSVYSVAWGGSGRDDCHLTSLPGVKPPSGQYIVQNPSADYPERFIYVKTTGSRDVNEIAWLRPVNEAGETAFHELPLRPTDAAFWENTVTSAKVSVREYPLEAGAQGKNLKEIFSNYIPAQAPPEHYDPFPIETTPTVDENNELLRPYGFEYEPPYYQYGKLYKDGALVVDNIYQATDIYRFETPDGERVAFLVYSLIDPAQPFTQPGNVASYSILNDTLTKWKDGPISPMEPEKPPILVRGDVLWVWTGEGTQILVQNSRGDILYSFESYAVTNSPLHTFRSWNDHWILEVSDFVIQDGEVLNEKYGFEEMFDWHLIEDKPVYFFRKGQRVGLSYDGQFLPFYYHDVLHGRCCGYASDNPSIDDNNTLRFIGRRDGIWYYVVVDFN